MKMSPKTKKNLTDSFCRDKVMMMVTVIIILTRLCWGSANLHQGKGEGVQTSAKIKVRERKPPPRQRWGSANLHQGKGEGVQTSVKTKVRERKPPPRQRSQPKVIQVAYQNVWINPDSDLDVCHHFQNVVDSLPRGRQSFRRML